MDKVMHKKSLRVVVTRPLPEGERTAAALRAGGHDAVLAPLMRVEPVPAVLAGDWSAVIITSANAVRALPAIQLAPLTALPLYAVGERSAAAAREAGFRDIHSAQGDAAALIDLIARRGSNKAAPHLYLAGQDRAADLGGTLAAKGIDVVTAVVYRAVTAGFPPTLIAAIGQGKIDAALHFSRRSAENFLVGAQAAGLAVEALGLMHLCLSVQVAEPLTAAGAPRVIVAPHPDEASLLSCLPG